MEWYALLIVLLVGLIASLVQGYSRRKYLREYREWAGQQLKGAEYLEAKHRRG